MGTGRDGTDEGCVGERTHRRSVSAVAATVSTTLDSMAARCGDENVPSERQHPLNGHGGSLRVLSPRPVWDKANEQFSLVCVSRDILSKLQAHKIPVGWARNRTQPAHVYWH